MSSEDIEAYAKLQGETKEWYVKDLPFYFGRETGKSPEAFLNICMDKKDKTVSREFAILQYNEDKKVYELTVKGKRGCYVNKRYYGKDQVCCLNDGDAISMVNCQFYFLLPQDVSEDTDRKNLKREATEELSIEENSKKPEIVIID